MQIEVLDATHDVTNCVTGHAAIDHYLHAMALTEQEQGLSRVYLAVEPDRRVVGFFTLSPISLRLDALLSVLPVLMAAPYPQIGGYLLGRMGVHASRAGEGIGGALVARAAEIARLQQRHVGGVFLAVDPKDDKLCGFYAKFGFRRLDPTSVRRRMILPLR